MPHSFVTDFSRLTTIMIYPNEFVHYKNTNFEHKNGLQVFPEENAPKAKIEPNKWCPFCKECIHGLQYIRNPESRRCVRFIWFLIILIACLGCICLYIRVAHLTEEQPLVTVVETAHLPIYKIEFPAVAVCPYNHVNWIRYRAAEEKYLPHDPPKEIREAFYDVLVAMENVTFTHLTPLERLIKRSSLPPVVRNISLHDLSQSMAYRCNEIFVWCIFDGTEYDCCKLFIRERTDQGICLVFNSLITKESRMKKVRER